VSLNRLPNQTKSERTADNGRLILKKGELALKEIKVKISKGKVGYTSKKDGTAREMDCIVMDFGNDKQTKLFADRFNYRVFDYLNDLLDGKI